MKPPRWLQLSTDGDYFAGERCSRGCKTQKREDRCDIRVGGFLQNYENAILMLNKIERAIEKQLAGFTLEKVKVFLMHPWRSYLDL